MIRALGLALALGMSSGSLLAQSPARQASQVGPVLPGLYMNRFIPPDSYARWYKAAEDCTHMRGDYERVEWLMVQAPWLEGQWKTLGSWEWMSLGYARIVVNRQDWMDSTLVMHEAIHDILWRNGWRPQVAAGISSKDSLIARHPSPPFDRCAPAFFTR